MISHTRRPRTLLGSAALALGLLGSSLSLGTAHAGVSLCRTDPTVYLSNGYILTMYADIQDQLSDVLKVSYTVHVPHGVYATRIVYDSTASVEAVSIVDDREWGGYTDTVVTTGTPSVPVTAHSALSGVAQGSVTGYSGQHLILSLDYR
jgi:hypothetical protein